MLQITKNDEWHDVFSIKKRTFVSTNSNNRLKYSIMIIEEIIKYNEQFVANKGYEKYLTSKTLEGFHDTEDSVRNTVNTIRNHPLVPKDVNLHGYIIDSQTGKLTEVK